MSERSPIAGTSPCGLQARRVLPARRRAGFTLLELLVVLALTALLLAVTPPLFTAAFPGVEHKTAARRVAAGLRLARTRAIGMGEEIPFIVDVEEHRFEIGDGLGGGRLPEGIELELVTAESEILDAGLGAIRFFPDGTSTGGRVTLLRNDHGYQVGVDWLTGRVRLATVD